MLQRTGHPTGRDRTAARRPLLCGGLWASMVIVAMLTGCAAASSTTSPIEHRVQGTGTPVVVFQSGLGDGAAVWQAVQTELGRVTTTVALSRPGYGRTPMREGSRSPCEVAELTRQFLRASGWSPPYVLVGHSLGGLYQYAFARRYPQEVAGLVLLDPTHPQHWNTLQRQVPALAAVIKAARATVFTAPMRREFDDQSLCSGQLQGQALPAVPVRLLVRERFTGIESGAFERVVHELEGDWSERLGCVAVTRVAGGGHYLQRDQPRTVSDAIAAVVAVARAQRNAARRADRS